MLRSARTVIVDEIHAVAGNKRGSHLTLTLERLAHVAEQPVQRVGLSATAAADRDRRPATGRRGTGPRQPGRNAPLRDRGFRSPQAAGPDPGAARRRARRGPDRGADGADPGHDRGARDRPPDHAGVRQHPEHGRAGRPPAGRTARRRPRRPCGGAPRVAVPGPQAAGRGPAARRGPARPGGHRLAGARHRRGTGRAGLPDRLAAQLRHLPAAGRPLQPHPHRHAVRAAVPDHPGRAGRMRRAAARHPAGPAGRHRGAGTAAGHPGAADGGRVGRRAVGGGRAARPGPAGGAVPRPVRRGLRGHHRPAGRGDPHRPRPPRLLPAPGPGERHGQGPPRRPAGRADLGRGHPRARRLPGRGRTRRGPDRHRPRGVGGGEQAG